MAADSGKRYRPGHADTVKPDVTYRYPTSLNRPKPPEEWATGEVIVELIDIELSEFTRRSRSVEVAHGAAGIDRGLEYGERVLVHTDGEYRTAVVADIDFALDDTHYRLVLGGRVPPELAQERIDGTVP